MADTAATRRWPAYTLALLFLGYAAAKGVLASQARLGFPGGPPVSAAETENYFLDPALGQWLACASGLLGAAVALATVTAVGRGLPRWPLLIALTITVLPVLGGGAIMALDGFIGLGVGWRWYHGVAGLVAIGLSLETTRSYVAATRRRSAR